MEKGKFNLPDNFGPVKKLNSLYGPLNTVVQYLVISQIGDL